MLTTGGGSTLTGALKPAIIERGGLRIAVLGFDGYPPFAYWATATRPGLAPATTASITQAVRAARTKADVVVVYVHWGTELRTRPGAKQQTLAKAALAAGADVVLGAHPHVLQPIVTHSSGRLVAYSLGNFVFNPGSVVATRTRGAGDRPRSRRRRRPSPASRPDRRLATALALIQIASAQPLESRSMSARDDAERLLGRAQRGVQRLLPPDTFVADAHTHLGLDEDGMRLDLPTTLEQMREWNVRRALVFPLHEADRAPAYRAPNDRVLGWAAESDGLLVPLARLDLDQSPIDEARRCLALGARGIKLHPRAQRFTVDDDRLDPVFALAEEHRLPVLIHAGRGMPPIGEHLAKVAERHPGAILILAHAAIVDQERICDLVAGLANVFFDTSTWGVVRPAQPAVARRAAAGAVGNRHAVRQPSRVAGADRLDPGRGRRVGRDPPRHLRRHAGGHHQRRDAGDDRPDRAPDLGAAARRPARLHLPARRHPADLDAASRHTSASPASRPARAAARATSPCWRS